MGLMVRKSVGNGSGGLTMRRSSSSSGGSQGSRTPGSAKRPPGSAKRPPRLSRGDSNSPFRDTRTPPRKFSSSGSLERMRTRDITPSRNPNHRSGSVSDGDRMLPFRSEDNLAFAEHELQTGPANVSSEEPKDTSASCPNSPSPRTKAERDTRKRMLRVRSAGDLSEEEKRVLAFRRGYAPQSDSEALAATMAYCYVNTPATSAKKVKTLRHVPNSPSRILDAPDIRDDFYYNVMDWSNNNIVVVALDRSVYLWKAATGDVEVLVDFERYEAEPCSVKFTAEGRYVAIGMSSGDVKLYDLTKGACVRTLRMQMSRVGCLEWSPDPGILTTGTRIGQVYNHDVRIQDHHIGTLHGHTSEICGLRWHKSGRYLISTGDVANVWERQHITSKRPETAPMRRFDEHTGTIKAVEFMPLLGPSVNMIATGGGVGDGTVRLFSLDSGMQFGCVHTRAPVTSIHFNKIHQEMFTTHSSLAGGVRLWAYTGEEEAKFGYIQDLKGHTGRVLSSVIAPNSEYVLTAAADESLRLWHCWPIDESVTGGTPTNNSAAKPPKITPAHMKITMPIR